MELPSSCDIDGDGVLEMNVQADAVRAQATADREVLHARTEAAEKRVAELLDELTHMKQTQQTQIVIGIGIEISTYLYLWQFSHNHVKPFSDSRRCNLK